MNKRTVGILTIWQWICRQDNYGSLLQLYALHQTLNDLGCTPVVLRCASDTEEAFHEELKSPFYYQLKILFSSKKKRRRAIERYFQTRHPRHFMAFAQKYLNLSPFNFALDDFENVDLRELDALVVGSDQVWIGPHPTYLCASTYRPKLCISYAASADWSKTEYFNHTFNKLNHHLTAISLREQEGVALCHALGRPDAKWVSDPTLLLSSMTWKNLQDSTFVPQGGVAAYMVGHFPKEHQRNLDQYAKTNNKVCWKVGVQGAEGDLLKTKNTLWLSPQQWLAWIASSELVVTNSFHGLCFAILFHRPFVVFCPPDKSPLRHLNLLSRLGLEDRLIHSLDEISTISTNPINWDVVDQRLETARVASIDFLSHAFSTLH